MSFQKNGLGALVGFWSIFWCTAGFQLAYAPQAPGPIAFFLGLSRETMASFLSQNGLASTDAAAALVVLGILALSVGLGFAFSLYLAEPEDTRGMVVRACGATAFLVLLVGAVGVSAHRWTLMVDFLLLCGLGLTAVVAAMDKHLDMPMMPVEPERFREALLQRVAQDEAHERYLEACRTSSRTSPAFASDKPIRSSMRQA